jgi:hypothetical protein
MCQARLSYPGDRNLHPFATTAPKLNCSTIAAPQRLMLQNALAQLRTDPLDWQSAVKGELDFLSVLPVNSWPSAQLTQAYLATPKDPSMLARLRQIIASLPQPVAVVFRIQNRCWRRKRT